MRGKKLHHYVGNYTRFLELRAERDTQAAATAAATAAEIERLEGFVARFGAKASKASQAQSRQKQLDRLRDAAPEAPAAASGAGPGDARKVTLKLPPPPPCFTDVIELQGVAAGWGEPAEGRTPIVSGERAGAAAARRAPLSRFKAFVVGARKLAAASHTPPSPAWPPSAWPVQAFTPLDPGPALTHVCFPPSPPQGVNAVIEKGQRVLVLGPNGAGKSTLLKTIGGGLAPWAGRVKLGEGAKLGVFSQDLAQVRSPWAACLLGGGVMGVRTVLKSASPSQVV